MTDALSFSRIIGQDKAKELLLRAAARERMGHAYLFRGPAGVGKKTTARAFAALINCAAPSETGACGSCPSCRKFMAGSHPDLLLIEPQGAAIKIDQIRELKKALSFAAFEANRRVVLLTEVQAMRREAANSLLKTLEEPPDDTLLILTGDEAGNILSTIVSRCQIIPFHTLAVDQVARFLETDSGLPPDTAATLAAVAEGSLGRARLLHDQGLLALRRDIIETIIELRPDHPQSVEAVFGLAARAAQAKEDLAELLDLLASWFRDLMLIRNNLPDRIINQDLTPALRKAAPRWNPTELSARLRMIGAAGKHLARNCNRTLVCEVLFFDLL